MERKMSAIVISITPFTEKGELDEPAFRHHLGRLREAGVTSYIAGSGTSEGNSLSTEERDRVLAIAVEELKGRSPVRAMGCEPRVVSQMVEYLQAAERAKVDAAQIFPLDMGHGAKPTSAEMEKYYSTAIESTSVPVILSSHHSAGYLIPLDLVEKLVNRYPSITGVVFADTNLKYLTEMMQRVDDRVELHCGGPYNGLTVLGLGGTGFMGHEGNIAPKLVASVINAYRSKDLAALETSYKKLMGLHVILAKTGGSAGRGLKPLMNALGLRGGYLRLPRLPVADTDVEGMVKAIRRLEIPELMN